MPELILSISLSILSVAAVLSFIRMLRGPTLPDRVVSFDLVGVLIVGIAIVTAAITREQAFLDVAMVIALVSFVGTVAYARYIERDSQS
jgi:multicomponent Na+:H+ antiporter subunit F